MIIFRVSNEGGFGSNHGELNKHLMVPMTIKDEVSFTNKDSLIATINHSGTLNKGSLLGFYLGLSLMYLNVI